MNEIDLDKVHLQAQEALQKIDFDAIQRQVNEAVENSAKASEHFSKEMVEKMKLQIEKAKKEHELSSAKTREA